MPDLPRWRASVRAFVWSCAIAALPFVIAACNNNQQGGGSY